MSAPPKIGIRLHGGMHPSECLRFAQTADDAGFDSLWFAENPFARGIIASAAICAAGTSRVAIGAGVFNPFGRHPAQIAMDIGALDEISGGRVSLGLGAGVAGAIESMGFSYDKPLSAVRDAVAIIRRALAGETVHYDGKVVSARNVTLGYAARADIAIYVAGRGAQTLAFCGAEAEGWIVSNMCTPGFIAAGAELMSQASTAAGRQKAPGIVRYVPCCVDADPAAAQRDATHAVAEMLPGFAALAKRVDTVRDGLLVGSGLDDGDIARAAERLAAGDDPARVLDRRFIAAYTIAGTPADCLAQMRAQAAQGITDFALTFAGATPLDDMRLLASAFVRPDPVISSP